VKHTRSVLSFPPMFFHMYAPKITLITCLKKTKTLSNNERVKCPFRSSLGEERFLKDKKTKNEVEWNGKKGMKDFEKFIIIFIFKNDRRINYQLQSL
jgi:hypothetical protein